MKIISLFDLSRFSPAAWTDCSHLKELLPSLAFDNSGRLQENTPQASHTICGICKSKLSLLQENQNLITSWSFWDTAQS